jgi:hypothetical protein
MDAVDTNVLVPRFAIKLRARSAREGPKGAYPGGS